MKIVTDKKFLSKPTEKVSTVLEGEDIAATLLNRIKNMKGALGISANQLGILKSVSVVNVREPVILINPRITKKSTEKLIYYEGCLSVPKTKVQTVRHRSVTVACDNWANERTFGPDAWDEKDYGRDQGLLECICVQHEIDHLNGILMVDESVKYRIPPVTNNVPKIGRNDKVFVQKGEKTERVKYKKALEMVNDGWKVI